MTDNCNSLWNAIKNSCLDFHLKIARILSETFIWHTCALSMFFLSGLVLFSCHGSRWHEAVLMRLKGSSPLSPSISLKYVSSNCVPGSAEQGGGRKGEREGRGKIDIRRGSQTEIWMFHLSFSFSRAVRGVKIFLLKQLLQWEPLFMMNFFFWLFFPSA